MNILQIVLAYYPATAYGGPVQSVRNLCSGLEEIGHKCTVCTTNCDGVRVLNVETGKPVKVDSSWVWYFNSPRWHYYGYSPAMMKWLPLHISEFDIVHINGIWSFPQHYAAQVARKFGVPYVISPRGSADARLVNRYRPLAKWLYVNVVDRQNFKYAAAIHYTTQAEEMFSIIKSVCRRAFIVPNASQFVFAETELKEDDFSDDIAKIIKGDYILFVGRITWKKQIDVLIKAFGVISDLYPELRLVVVGPDDEGLVGDLNILAESNSVENRVMFTGMMEGAALKALYRNAKLFISASISENFGHTIVEAMSYSVPVIVSENVDLTTMDPVRDICLVCQPEVDSVVKSIITVFDDYDNWCKRAQKGPAIVRKMFSSCDIACQTAGEYKKLLPEKKTDGG